MEYDLRTAQARFGQFSHLNQIDIVIEGQCNRIEAFLLCRCVGLAIHASRRRIALSYCDARGGVRHFIRRQEQARDAERRLDKALKVNAPVPNKGQTFGINEYYEKH